MARPKTPHPTPAELEILKVLWERGPLTVREVLDVLNQQGPPRAYTTLMSLMTIMADKEFLAREPLGRAFRYRPIVARQQALQGLLGDLWQRAFGGSAAALVANLLEETNPTPEELAAIRQTLQQFEQRDDTPREPTP
jgi:predicted transcriptional regulator